MVRPGAVPRWTRRWPDRVSAPVRVVRSLPPSDRPRPAAEELRMQDLLRSSHRRPAAAPASQWCGGPHDSA